MCTEQECNWGMIQDDRRRGEKGRKRSWENAASSYVGVCMYSTGESRKVQETQVMAVFLLDTMVPDLPDGKCDQLTMRLERGGLPL